MDFVSQDLTLELALSIIALVASFIAMVSAIKRFREQESKAAAAAAEREAWTLEQIARWRRGELTAKQEPSITGGVDVLVIEPKPGHRIVVGTDLHGRSGFSAS